MSLSDRYKITSNTCYEKKYDVILIGRQNPVLKDFLDQYKKTHPDLTIFIPSKQELASRDGYLDSMKKSRIALYATPGIDGGEKRTNGFSQVTPRFLEMVASGLISLQDIRLMLTLIIMNWRNFVKVSILMKSLRKKWINVG